MAQIFIKPAVKGHVIRHPEKMQHIIDQDGEYVEDAPHWRRKILQGDVVLAEPPQQPKPTAKQKHSEGDQ